MIKQDIKETIKNSQDLIVKDFPTEIREAFIRICKKSESKIRTHLAIAQDIKTFIYYLSTINNISTDKVNISHFNLSFIEASEYLDFLENYEKDGKVYKNSNVSKARKLSSVKKLYKQLRIAGLVESNSFYEIDIGRDTGSEMKNTLDMDTIRELSEEIEEGISIKGISNYRLVSAYNKLKERDLAIVYILSLTGIRVSELVGLDITDYSERNSTIKLYRKNGKIQELPLPQDAEEKLIEYIKNSRNDLNTKGVQALFISNKGNRISTKAVRDLVNKYSERADILDNGKVTCHTLRRSFLTELYGQTNDIKLVAEVGGHSVETASKYYVKVNEERIRTELKDFSFNKNKK